MQSDTLIVTGMQCGGCVNKLALALNRIVGVADVQISLASGEVTVRYDAAQTSPSALNEWVIRTGFGVDGISPTNGHAPRPSSCG